MDMEQRVGRIENILQNHEQTIKALSKLSNEQSAANNDILNKLNKLLFIEEQARETFDHHRLVCRGEFDNIYQFKKTLRPDVLDIVNTRQVDLLNSSKTKSSLLINSIDLFWKICVISGVLAIIAQNIMS